MKAIAGRIKERRTQLGYTQEQFAEVIDLSSSSYTKIENAFQKPALDTFIRIADKLEISLDYLVFGGERPQRADSADVMRAALGFADADKITHTIDLLSKIIKAKVADSSAL